MGMQQPPVSADRPVAAPVSLQAIVDAHPRLELRGEPELVVTGITLNSASVRPGDLFAALPGEGSHGVQFLDEAIRLGAVACLTDEAGLSGVGDLPTLISHSPRAALGGVAAQIFGYPAQQLAMVGITGTNGKTTVAHLTGGALRECGTRTGIIGTAGVSTDDRFALATRTTPEAPALQGLLAQLRSEGMQAVCMEVSSHALKLNRVDGVRFDLAAFTNLSQDHLDFHGTMENYFEAKAMLFTPQRCARAVVCIDDEWGVRLAQEVQVPLVTVSVTGVPAADYRCTSVESQADGSQRLIIVGPNRDEHLINISLPGSFNAENALVAWTLAHLLSVDDSCIDEAFTQARVPGRMELVDAGQDFSVVVDYAHTPDAVERVLRSLRESTLRTGSSLICVLGCGGDRDREKRPEMGRIAATNADLVIITDDNPRGEEAEAIRSSMMVTMNGDQRERVVDLGDRDEVISVAIERARQGDVVAILGKGHESGQEIKGTVYPFDDRSVALTHLRRVAR